MIRSWLLGVTIVVASASSAHAGRTHFAWLYGTELNPERGVELETWIIDMHKLQKANGVVQDETDFWWGVTLALTEHFELAIPIEAEYVDDGSGMPTSQYVRFGGELRWRPQSPDPIEAGPLTNLVRVGVKRMIDARLGVRPEADVVTTYQSGAFLATLDLGSIAEIVSGQQTVVEFRPGAGASMRVGEGVRVGLETYGEWTVKGPDPSWQVIGPTVSLTRGRFWGAGSVGPGLFGTRVAGRITLGVAL